ncbi:LemA family protein [Parvularcula dongshanensis]|uniref:LemA protein n=1 Tax=Parvularcula dongshanensis TaxID=1173995 RepID=A0A840I0T1_9PROT|nr:LemA family protein [Parvularcula dongshanensis]MBB4657710.1 LemA protein [Parvularcula dongshanensis]
MEFVFLVLGLLVLVVGYAWYAAIVSRRNKVAEALGSIDAHLQQRADLVPNLLKLARRYMEHERSLVEDVTRLRGEAQAPYDKTDPGAVGRHLAAAEALDGRLGQLRVQVEAYPELRSEGTVTAALERMAEVEAQLTAARRYYNAAVAELNTAIQIFPGTLIAERTGTKALPSYAAQTEARGPIDADAYLT